MKKKLCVVTGTRADYGQLSVLMRAIASSNDLELQILVTGTHFSCEFGSTVNELRSDGFIIDGVVESQIASDSRSAVCKSIGMGLIGASYELERLGPDALIVLGDRYEILAIVIAAHVSGIPVIHLHGGESTFGQIDEAIRHSITKFSTLHFTSTDAYRQRVIQLGEHPRTVFNVGAMGIDAIIDTELISERGLRTELGIHQDRPVLTITYHPVTLASDMGLSDLKLLFNSVRKLDEFEIVFTAANADMAGLSFNELISQFCSEESNRYLFNSLGRVRYLSLLKISSAVIGNSSSAILEAPFLGIPSIDIGERQAGRVIDESVLHVSSSEFLRPAIDKVLKDGFMAEFNGGNSIYFNGGATEKIMHQIRAFDFSDNDLRKKTFYNLI